MAGIGQRPTGAVSMSLYDDEEDVPKLEDRFRI